MSALDRVAAKAEADRQVSRALVDFYRNATALVQEILDGGDDPTELHAKTHSLREEIDQVEKRVREALFDESEPPAGGQDPDVAAVANAARSTP